MTEKKITIISNGIESIYINYNNNNFKYKEHLILLIKIANTEGEKIIFLRSEERFNWLIEEFKIKINNYRIIPISWIDDFNEEIYKIKDSNVFVFLFESYCKEPEFLKNQSYERDFEVKIDSETKLVFDEYDREILKKRFIESSVESNVNYYFSQSLISQEEKQKFEKFNYTIYETNEGRLTKSAYNANYLKIKKTFDSFKIDELMSRALKSNKYAAFYYPIRNFHGEFEEDEITEIVFPNNIDYNQYLSRFIWNYLNQKSISFDHVPSLLKDNSGNYIYPFDINAKDANGIDVIGKKFFTPSQEYRDELNSIHCIQHYLVNGTIKYFCDEGVQKEIDLFLDSLLNEKYKFFPFETIYSLLDLIESDRNYMNIYILNANIIFENSEEYLNSEYYKILRRIDSYAIYKNINLRYIL